MYTMKNLLFFLLLILQSSTALNAQKTEPSMPLLATNDQEIRQATEALTAKYTLNTDQAKQMYRIQLRKAKNLADIAAFQNSNPALYRAKSQNVQKGTLASIRRIFNTKAQMDLYQKTLAEIRLLQSRKQKEMTTQKASREAIETALLAVYIE